MPVVRRVRKLLRLAKQGDGALIGDDVRRWLNSDTESFGFRRDFAKPLDPPPSILDVEARPLDAELAAKLFDAADVAGPDQVYLQRRRTMWEMGFSGGYVAVDPAGQPAYLQFYIPHDQAELVRRHWGGLFPAFGPDTLLLEGAWVPPGFRGRGVMAQCLHLTSEAAKADSSDNVRFADAFVDAGNRGARTGCLDAGYELFQRRIESWRFGRHTFRFEPVDGDG